MGGAGENDGERLHEFRIVREVETLGEWDGSARRACKAPGLRQGQIRCSRQPPGRRGGRSAARSISRPADQGKAAIVLSISCGSWFQLPMMNQHASRRTIDSTGP